MGEVNILFRVNGRGYVYITKNSLNEHIQSKILTLLNIPHRKSIPAVGWENPPQAEPLEVYRPSNQKFRRGIYCINNIYYWVMGLVNDIPLFVSDRYDSKIIKEATVHVYTALSSNNEQVLLSADTLDAPSAALVATVTEDGRWVTVGDTVSYQNENAMVSKIDKYLTNQVTVVTDTVEKVVDLPAIVPADGSTVPFGREHSQYINIFSECSPLDMTEPLKEAKILSKLSRMMCEYKKAVFQDAKVTVDEKGITFCSAHHTHTTKLTIPDLHIGPINAKRVNFSYDDDELIVRVKAPIRIG